MKIAVLGGGFSGLYLAHRLGREHEVHGFEASGEWGGLAASTTVGGLTIDRYYHFICLGDRHYLALLDELDLSGEVAWSRNRTGFFHGGRIYPFSTPLDLLRFTPVTLPDRLRFAFHIAKSRLFEDWKPLDAIGAKAWLESHIGPEAYRVIWDPLLRIKFGPYHEAVSAAWIWHRIHRVARSRRIPWQPETYGVLRRGTGTVVEALVRAVERAGGPLHPASPVEAMRREGGRFFLRAGGEEHGPFDACVSTLPLPLLGRLVEPLDPAYARTLGSFDYLGVRCLVARLKRPLTPHFWLNVNDPRVSFPGIIELSHLVPERRERGEFFAYFPHYLMTGHPTYREDEGEFRSRILAALPHIVPEFRPDWVLDMAVGRAPFAQVVCPTGFASRIPDQKSPVPGLFITDSSHLYPEDRTLDGLIRVADRAVAGVRDYLSSAALPA